MVDVKPPTKHAIYRIVCNMRDADRREVYPLLYHDNPLILAEETMQWFRYGRTNDGKWRGGIIWADGLPISLFGVCKEFNTSVHYRVFAYGTNDWKKGVYVMMRELRKLVRTVIEEEGTMRMQADSHEDHHEAHRWMERMGGRRESIMRHYGKNGETFYRYVWLRDEPKWTLDEQWTPWAVKPAQMDLEEII